MTNDACQCCTINGRRDACDSQKCHVARSWYVNTLKGELAVYRAMICEMRAALTCLISATREDETGLICTSDVEAASYVANAAIAKSAALLAGTDRKCDTCHYNVTDSECPAGDPCCGFHNGFYKWKPEEEIAR